MVEAKCDRCKEVHVVCQWGNTEFQYCYDCFDIVAEQEKKKRREKKC